MSIKSFWLIFFKILGLLLIAESILLVSNFFSATSIILEEINNELFSTEILVLWLILIVALGLYFLFLYVLIFRASWIIKKLSLVEEFEEEKIELNISSKSILTIATIVFGGLILIEAFPQFLIQLYNFFVQKNAFVESPSSRWVFFYLVQSLIGYFFVFNNRVIVNFFESQINKNNKE